MKSKEKLWVMQKILHHIEEGVHVVDDKGNTIIYNESMAKLEKMKEVDVLEKPLLEVFKDMKNSESTLLTALKNKTTIKNKKQIYLNKDGKEIITINNTMPIIFENKLIGALEIAKNITDIQEMSDTILDLQKEIYSPSQSEGRIKKYTFENIFGKNKDFLKAVNLGKKASQIDASVFIYGETGTGKELLAQSIHYASKRRDKPFIAQNCAALPESLLEGILFGTAKGGFTGAIDRPGLFEQASGGTLFLDEINSMPYELQAKLLRVLQEGYIRRIGGTKDTAVNVRVIASSNEPPKELIEKKLLRKDLFYRLNIIPINIPPLRNRKDDIVPLSEFFIKKYNKLYDKEIWILSDKAKEKLYNHHWPGNARELENTIMAAFSMIDDEHVISDQNIIIYGLDEDSTFVPEYDIGNENLNDFLEKMEKHIIIDTLRLVNGNITKAAIKLGIKRQTLQHKIKKLNI